MGFESCTTCCSRGIEVPAHKFDLIVPKKNSVILYIYFDSPWSSVTTPDTVIHTHYPEMSKEHLG